MPIDLRNIGAISPNGSGAVTVTNQLTVTGDVDITGTPAPVYRINGVPLSTGGAVTTVFGRSGAVVATAGDYTAAQVTNAVDSSQTYANPAWITSLDWSKISNPPATGVSSVFGRTGAVTAAAGDYNATQINLNPQISTWTTVQAALGGLNTAVSNIVSSQWINGTGTVIYYDKGNVGIGAGTASASASLVINRSDGWYQLELDKTGAAARRYAVAVGWPASGNAFLHFDDLDAGLARMVINTQGYIGIGTSDPRALLALYQGAGGVLMRFEKGTAPTQVFGLGIDDNDQFFIEDSDFNRRVITIAPNSGNLSITTLLTVKYGNIPDSTGQPTGTWAGKVYNATNAPGMNGLLVKNNWLAADSTIFQVGSDAVGGGFQSRFIVNGAGRIGISTPTPSTLVSLGTDILPIKLALYDGGATACYGIGVDGVNAALTFGANINPSSGAPQMLLTSTGRLGLGGNPGYQLHLSTDSAAKPGTNTWTIASDIRTKRHTQPLGGGLDIINQLEPIVSEYNGKANTPNGQRVVSLDPAKLQEILPHSVSSFRSKLDPEDQEETDILGVNTHEILYHLVLAVQQLAKRRN